VTDAAGAPLVTAVPAGYGPGDLRSAYGLTALSSTAGSGQTLAIVDAYDDPNAEADLAVYRSQYGLPACTHANGCFTKVNQRGTSAPPQANTSWAQEISLDLDMASAICPGCHILLVEANSERTSDLGVAVDRAATLGATQISNSYGADEYPGEIFDEAHYDHPGVAITASSGDSGYGVQFPAASRFVTAVGGTSLVRDAGAPRGFTESAWSGAGSGCSAYVAKPTWQTDPGCDGRSVADVSAIADPQTGVAVYDSVDNAGSSGWMVFGGTSVSAPVVAAYDALLGSSAASTSYFYAHLSSYMDVIAGANGTCDITYLCAARPGYDGPTGLGAITTAMTAPLAIATTTAATAITTNTAIVNANVNPNTSATTAHFEYGTTTAYGSVSAEQPVGSDSSEHASSASLTDLLASSTYHYRVVATTDCACPQNTTEGADATFTTTASPRTPPPSSTTGLPALVVTDPVSIAAGIAPTLVTSVARAVRQPANLKVRTATITADRLRVVAAITPLADGGVVTIAFRAHNRTIHFTARVSRGRLRFVHRLPRAQQHASNGTLTIAYPGADKVDPARIRMRALRT
jgi:subtilase family serine protease